MAEQWQIDFWQQRLDAKLALLAQYDAGVTALTGGVLSYTINTGQTQQTVTRSSIGMMKTAIADLEREIEELLGKLNGVGRTTYVTPGF